MQENNASRMFLIAAVVLGLLATVIAFAYLQAHGGGSGKPPIHIVAAKHDLAPNHVIDPDKDLKDAVVPGEYAAFAYHALSPDAMGSYKGQRVNRRILADEPVNQADISTGAADFELTGDQRAITIKAQREKGLGGNLVPGDWVKLYVTEPVVHASAVPPTADPSDPTARLLGSTATAAEWTNDVVLPTAVKVLAVGHRLSKTRQQVTQAEQYSEGAESQDNQTVTLLVNEGQVDAILKKTGGGTLNVYLILCPPPTAGASATERTN